MGSPPQPPTPSSFSPFRRFVAQLAAAPPGRDGSTADSFPFDDNRDEKQKEGILEIIKISDVVSEKAARHDETCLAQVADEEEGSAHNHLDRILDSGASMHATGNLRLLSEFTRAPGGSSAAVYHTRDGKDLRIAGAGSFSPIDADAIPFFLPVISCGSPGPQKLDVQLERVIAAFDNRKLILNPIEENLSAAFPKAREDILAPLASSSTDPGAVAESKTRLLLDSGASFHAVGEPELLTAIEPSTDKSVKCADGNHLPILGRGTLQTAGFSIPGVRLVRGLTTNLVSVSQLDRDHGLCCCFHGKQCQVIGADGTVVGGAILQDNGMYQLRFLEVAS